jgi:hypothetical protein
MASSLYGRGLAERIKGNQAASDKDLATARKLQPTIAADFTKWGVPVPTP